MGWGVFDRQKTSFGDVHRQSYRCPVDSGEVLSSDKFVVCSTNLLCARQQDRIQVFKTHGLIASLEVSGCCQWCAVDQFRILDYWATHDVIWSNEHEAICI